MTIQFPNTEAWHVGTLTIAFPAITPAGPVQCRISMEALQDNFGGAQVKPMDAFLANRPAIENRVRRKIEAHQFEPDGSVLVRSEDGR